jgi:hypothetical protein
VNQESTRTVHFLELLKSVFYEERNVVEWKERNEMEREKQNVFAFIRQFTRTACPPQ